MQKIGSRTIQASHGKANTDGVFPYQPSWLASLQAQRPLRGWSPRLQACLRWLGRATEAKRLVSRGLQGLGSYAKRTTVGAFQASWA
ncbi:hypothetical protein B0B52_17660 [Polaromonas sp. A23]|nr:hypothetical protein B0B52_17660 [Polaromonas sp. A23]